MHEPPATTTASPTTPPQLTVTQAARALGARIRHPGPPGHAPPVHRFESLATFHQGFEGYDIQMPSNTSLVAAAVPVPVVVPPVPAQAPVVEPAARAVPVVSDAVDVEPAQTAVDAATEPTPSESTPASSLDEKTTTVDVVEPGTSEAEETSTTKASDEISSTSEAEKTTTTQTAVEETTSTPLETSSTVPVEESSTAAASIDETPATSRPSEASEGPTTTSVSQASAEVTEAPVPSTTPVELTTDVEDRMGLEISREDEDPGNPVEPNQDPADPAIQDPTSPAETEFGHDEVEALAEEAGRLLAEIESEEVEGGGVAAAGDDQESFEEDSFNAFFGQTRRA